jgi:hypothetical protein
VNKVEVAKREMAQSFATTCRELAPEITAAGSGSISEWFAGLVESICLFYVGRIRTMEKAMEARCQGGGRDHYN